MSTINYNLKNKGIRLIDSRDAWIVGKSCQKRLNPDYRILGKIEMTMPNMIVSASDRNKPRYKGNTYDLNNTAKSQIVNHFYDDKGKRNKKTVAYFGIKKNKKSNGRKK